MSLVKRESEVGRRRRERGGLVWLLEWCRQFVGRAAEQVGQVKIYLLLGERCGNTGLEGRFGRNAVGVRRPVDGVRKVSCLSTGRGGHLYGVVGGLSSGAGADTGGKWVSEKLGQHAQTRAQ